LILDFHLLPILLFDLSFVCDFSFGSDVLVYATDFDFQITNQKSEIKNSSA